jgi:hypothetical protein
VEVSLWVRAPEAGLDQHLYETVRHGIAATWPFANPAYPGREIAWEDWRALPEG